ncbi:type III-A CRISPR-associated RAMP protein Csm5 [Lactobacillus delbrueckii subsp. bulgaricus]|nr:type III-A CRISPR-associated RAMP protein Csm5 [Lactobacillus delbrueckii subsp. bulgaricus]
MKQYREFEFKLRTLAPVFIGSGETYKQREYIYENDAYYFPNFVTLYRKLSSNQRQQEAFENYLMSSRRQEKNMRLGEFLRKINFTDRDLGGYSIKATGVEVENNGDPDRLNEIAKFIKDPQGRPYIPGTSLKGAIRTILINTRFKGVEKIPWGGSDDIFHDIRVSDSEPLKLSSLVITKKWDYNTRKDGPNPLPLTRECLKPYTKVIFTITTVGDEAAEIISGLSKAADEFYKRYEERFLKDLDPKYRQSGYNHPIYLGGGSGLWTKANYDRINIEQIRSRTPRKMKMTGNGVFKLTKAKRQSYRLKIKGVIEERELVGKNGGAADTKDGIGFYEMGKCCFTIKEKK